MVFCFIATPLQPLHRSPHSKLSRSAKRAAVESCSISRTQSPARFFLGQTIEANQFLARLMTTLQHDSVFRDFQFFGQKTTKSGISFPFHCRCAELHLDRVSMLADHRVALRIRNNVKS